MSPLPTVPPDPTDAVADDPRAAPFGQYLFFDTRISANGRVSCASCHRSLRAFTDGRRIGIAIGTDSRNTPTLLNVSYNHWFFWDGRADSLWAQALYVMEAPTEFGSDRLHIAHVVGDDPALRRAYVSIFGPLPPLADAARFLPHAKPEPGHPDMAARAWQAMRPADRQAIDRLFSNLGKAIEAYERRLVSAAGPFDLFVVGLGNHDAAEQAAILEPAGRGLRLFVGAAHCNLCHSGPDFSDGQFHNPGLPVLPGEPADIGRAGGIPVVREDMFNGASPFSDDRLGSAAQKLEFLPPPQSQLGAFKTPTLRNIALTAPYFHDGRAPSLRAVVSFYARGEPRHFGRLIGKREMVLNLSPHLTQTQISDIVAFLRRLNGKPLDRSLLVQPAEP